MTEPERNGTAETPEAETPEAEAPEEEAPPALDADSREEALAQAAEAIIFAADEPVPAARIAALYADVTGEPAPDAEAVEAAVEGLNDAYDATGRAFQIHTWAGGFRMATRPALAPFVKAHFAEEREASLSRSLMETLAIVAYRQPVTRPEIEFVRGVSADYAVRKLLEYGLVDVQGRSDALGRPLLYGTTGRFLEQFGLHGLDDLPTLREINDLLDDPRFDDERAELLNLKRAAEGVAQEQDSEAEAKEEDDVTSET